MPDANAVLVVALASLVLVVVPAVCSGEVRGAARATRLTAGFTYLALAGIAAVAGGRSKWPDIF